MPRRLASAVLALAAYAASAAAQVDINLQNLLAALTQGTEVTLLTPATNGMVQVTSFVPPQRYSGADAAALVESARRRLAELGVARPTGEQLATALVGGTLELPTGRTQLAGLLPGAAPVALRTEVVFATALPQVIAAPAPTR
ncbi:MAG: hypothetical protein ACT4P4_27010 [Betaproteobacteria bacterium]